MSTDCKHLFAQIRIVVHPNKSEKDENGRFKTNHYHFHTIRKYNYPKWIVDKHGWFFQWVQALVQCRFPKHHVGFQYCGYFPDTNEKTLSRRKMAISAAQGQITKVNNQMELIREYSRKSLFQDYTELPEYVRLQTKLEEKKFKLQELLLVPIEETI
jgi:hypothetical protein